MTRRYSPRDIEPKWQAVWESEGTYTTNLNSNKPKYIAMSMFNYPSGSGIHIGHAMNYTISDVKARFKRQQGYESYHPVGWDAFGLPAENFAIKSGVSPQQSMAEIIPGYHKQYKAMGWSNDWQKEIATHLPEYYRWTQSIFSQMYKHGLAYQASRLQWWCSIDNTVLANEQVIDGKCWRHDGPNDPLVEKKEIKQWFFKITEYAEELLEAIDDLDWTESVKLAQKNWIGKSQGAEIDFQVANSKHKITVFTTRADTIFGATFLVLAPEHGLVKDLTTKNQKTKVNNYLKQVATKSELERQTAKEKTGVFLGSYAVNPINGEAIPVYIADYVLLNYGSGAIMAVPAHDERDYQFAKKYKLPIRQVVAQYFLGNPKEDIATVNRQVVDAIVRNQKGQYLLIKDLDGYHFCGGGVESTDLDNRAAIRREVIEETGYHDIKSLKPVAQQTIFYGYRATKNRNQRTLGQFFEVILASDQQIDNESNTGKHTLHWFNKDEVLNKLAWDSHVKAFEQYLNSTSCYSGEGLMINSAEFDDLTSDQAREQIIRQLSKQGWAREKINYRMKDWSVSRQRYWGAPIPIIYCQKCGTVLVPDADLPVIIPELEDFAPSGDGHSALARAKDWLKVSCPKCGGPAERETDTLDTYICSSWYMLRYIDPHNQVKIFDTDLVNKWLPIDFYNGADHATAHLLYARFITRFFNKLGQINHPEPFKQMLYNGKVTSSDGSMFSKSKGNGIDPLEIINQGYGADALRTYLMFAAPLELSVRWDPKGVPGVYRFLNRVWTLIQAYLEQDKHQLTDKKLRYDILHATNLMVDKVSKDLNLNQYNTAIATMMAYLNDLYRFKDQEFNQGQVWQTAFENLIVCLAPFAPHISEELWHQLGHTTSVHKDSWPEVDKSYLVDKTVTIVIQVNGKVRATLKVKPGETESLVIGLAKKDNKIKEYLAKKDIKKTIYLPDKLVNFVV
jgi:leucyl-tRNA synthetase